MFLSVLLGLAFGCTFIARTNAILGTQYREMEKLGTARAVGRINVSWFGSPETIRSQSSSVPSEKFVGSIPGKEAFVCLTDPSSFGCTNRRVHRNV